MSAPRILKTQNVLDIVKDNLLKQNSNIEVLDQEQYKSEQSALPSLKIKSFILYKNLENDSLNIAKTEGLEIQQILNVEEFKSFIHGLSNDEQNKLLNIINKIDSQNTKKPKI